MNEQIRALAKEAGIYYYRKGKLQVDMEKFAEVLIAQCIRAIENESCDSGDSWELGLHYAKSAIKERFGINS